MELKNITDKVAYIPNSSNIGVVLDNKDCILIDSGLDSDTGKKICRTLEEEGISVKAIINTHSHSDHCGGNRVIKEKTNCVVCAPKIECSIIENPILEPVSFFSGASPIQDLKNKFLMAEPCKVDKILEIGEFNLNSFSLTIVPLPGHSINQIGVAVGNILFCADSFFSKETIEKHKIPFFSDIVGTKNTLNFLKESKYKTFIPSHFEPLNDIAEAIGENLGTIEKIEKNVFELLKESKNTENLLKELCNNLAVKISSVQQHYLLKTAVMAYLEDLHKNKKIKTVLADNQLEWIQA